MTTGLAETVESAIKKQFNHIFDSKEAVIAPVTSPKFKLKWLESQEKKETYKQMIIDELCLHASTTSSDVVIEEEHPTQAPKKGRIFITLTQKMKKSHPMM